MSRPLVQGYVALAIAILACGPLAAEDQAPAAAKALSIAEGKYSVTPDAGWTAKKPSVRIIDYEFEIPAAEGDELPGRLTIMASGGGVDANVERWKGQFSGKDATSKVAEEKVNGQAVHVVNLSGTYADRKGPFAPAVQRDDYRMLGAIVQLQEKQGDKTVRQGDWYFKLYGPKKTVDANEAAFLKMIRGLKKS